MGNKLSLRKAVVDAADALWARGTRPTQRKVLAYIGYGSFTDIGPALRLWQAQAGKPKPAPMAAVTAAADDIDMVPRAEMAARIALIEERAEGERRHLMIMTDRIREEIAAPLKRTIERQEGELVLLRARVRALEAERR